MNDEIFARVKAFVAKHSRIAEEKFTPEAQLLDDLGIDGDDAFGLIEAFGEEFGMQDMNDFHFEAYFFPENYGCSMSFLYHLLFDRKEVQRTPITLRGLAESAEAKRWIPPKVRRML